MYHSLYLMSGSVEEVFVGLDLPGFSVVVALSQLIECILQPEKQHIRHDTDTAKTAAAGPRHKSQQL